MSLLKNVAPSHDLIQIVETMVDKLVTMKGHEHKNQKKELQEQLQLTKRKIDQFLDRIVTADSPTLVSAYERQIKQLEEQRIIMEEKISKCGKVDDALQETARTALEFIANPYAHWVSGDLPKKRLVLKATFARPLAYHRNEGYRTAALALPFSLLRDFSDSESDLVPWRGLEPPHPCEYMHLKHARLPIPPPGHGARRARCHD